MTRILPIVLLLLTLALPDQADARRRSRKARATRATPAATLDADVEPATLPTSQGEEDGGTGGGGGGAAGPGSKAAKGGKGGVKVMDFTGLSVDGKLRTPQLLYFLGRAKEELERASLENRSFMPELVRSVDQGAL